jgi:precorrin-2/cobalt-factor-2 C20-methyltransferase
VSARLVGIGVGPGDPELVTVKAARELAEADIVVVPVADLAERGRAETVVARYTQPEKVRRVVFALTAPAEGRGPGETREAAWDAAAAAVGALLDAHATVAFATLGDPAIYSTFGYLAQTVTAARPDVRIDTVPGVMALADLASRAGITLVEGTETLMLVPLTAGPEVFARALDAADTVVAYKTGRRLPEALATLDAAGRRDDAVLGAGLGTADQVLQAGGDIAAAPYFATLAVTPRRPTRGGRL